MSTILLATAGDLLRGLIFAALIGTLTWAAVTFHRAGMARVHRGGAHVARLRPGMRTLADEERRELRRRQVALEEAAEAWLSPAHREAKALLCRYVAELADDHVPLSQVADVMGVRKQRAHQQAVAGRAQAAPT